MLVSSILVSLGAVYLWSQSQYSDRERYEQMNLLVQKEVDDYRLECLRRKGYPKLFNGFRPVSTTDQELGCYATNCSGEGIFGDPNSCERVEKLMPARIFGGQWRIR
jgi:hypothetical protein